MKWLNKLERKHIPNFRKNKGYLIAKLIIIAPIAVPLYYIGKACKYIVSLFVIKRKYKPDIKLQNIINGWSNLMFTDPDVEVLARGRATICAGCPLAEMSGGVYTMVIDNKTTNVRGLICTGCGCPISAKIRNPYEECPQKKW
jgi:hypothetical protein